MQLALRNAMLPRRRLPYDAEIEYLESTGAQFIQLPFGFYKTDEVEARFALVDSSKSSLFIVAPSIWSTPDYFGMGKTGNIYTVGCGSKSFRTAGLKPSTYWDYDFHTWIYSSCVFNFDFGVASFDGTAATFGSGSAPLKLFYGSTSNTPGKIAYYKHVKDGAVAADLIAVRFTNEQGVSEGAMFDKRGTGGINPDGSQRDDGLYRNSGTGAFVMGPDK